MLPGTDLYAPLTVQVYIGTNLPTAQAINNLSLSNLFFGYKKQQQEQTQIQLNVQTSVFNADASQTWKIANSHYESLLLSHIEFDPTCLLHVNR